MRDAGGNGPDAIAGKPALIEHKYLVDFKRNNLRALWALRAQSRHWGRSHR
jgi:hypothetical protein